MSKDRRIALLRVVIRDCERKCLEMNRKKLSSNDFLAVADIIWNGAAKVRYQNPDAWTEDVRGMKKSKTVELGEVQAGELDEAQVGTHYDPAQILLR